MVRVATVIGPALVLGSGQVAGRLDVEGAAAQRVEVARRRSGGGAVLLWPGHQVWLDVCLPRDDPLWDDDVGRSARWLGAALASALVGLGAEGARAHLGPIQPSAWSHQVCFAGRAPGEVVVAGRKVVGTSQRRSRDGAVFQVAVALVWAPRTLVDLLGLPAEAGAAVADTAVGLGELVRSVRAADVVAAVVSSLPV
jgi:lipoate-protein ligase A